MVFNQSSASIGSIALEKVGGWVLKKVLSPDYSCCGGSYWPWGCWLIASTRPWRMVITWLASIRGGGVEHHASRHCCRWCYHYWCFHSWCSPSIGSQGTSGEHKRKARVEKQDKNRYSMKERMGLPTIIILLCNAIVEEEPPHYNNTNAKIQLMTRFTLETQASTTH